MPTRTHIEKARRIYREKGLIPFLQFLTKRLVIERVHRVVYDALLDEDPPSAQHAAECEIAIWKNEADIPPELFSFIGGEDSREYLSGLPDGDLLFAVRDGSEYVHYGFVLLHSRQIGHLGDAGPLPLIANCYTSPASRGRGIYRCALTEELRYLRTQGYRRVLIETSSGNWASRRGIEAAGFQLIREMCGFVLLRKLAVQWITTKQGRSLRFWIV